MLNLKPVDVLRSRYTALRATRAVLTASGLVLLCVWCSDAEAPSTREPYPEVECPAVVDVRQDDVFTGQAGRKVPSKPENWMQRAPCKPENDETEIAGACFVELARKPPCKPGQYEHTGRCWAAIAKQRRPSTSIGATMGD